MKRLTNNNPRPAEGRELRKSADTVFFTGVRALFSFSAYRGYFHFTEHFSPIHRVSVQLMPLSGAFFFVTSAYSAPSEPWKSTPRITVKPGFPVQVTVNLHRKSVRESPQTGFPQP